MAEIRTLDKTKAGNYFVANYPPFSFWTAEQASQAIDALERPPRADTPLGLYVHIPFCRKRCHFCYFKVYTGANSTQVNLTLDTLVQELSLYAAKSFVGGRKPSFIYFGGGTPSFLSARQLESLAGRLQELLPWDEAEEIAFECEPGTLTEAKLEAIRKVGVTRLSLGVEHFDDEILELNGRAHRSPEIGRAYDFARGLGFPQINIDLIAGMMGDTDEKWQQAVEKTIELAPDSVTIYQMEIPYNTTIFKQMREQGREIAPVADWKTKRRWVDEAFARMEEAGYTVTSAYTVVKDPDRVKFVYRDRLWEGADMLALGVASFSHVNGVHYQNEHNLEPWIEKVQNGKLPIFRALPINEEEQLVREFILKMKLGRVQADGFRRKFGVDVLERFAEPLKEWEDEGFLAVRDDAVVLTRRGLLQVDSLLPAFFLPQHRDARYA